jgi:CIC family chloride channel protein
LAVPGLVGGGEAALSTEMMDSVPMLLPKLSACATARLTPALIGDPPIYESLRERTRPAEKTGGT